MVQERRLSAANPVTNQKSLKEGAAMIPEAFRRPPLPL